MFFIRPVYSARLHRMARSIFSSVSGSVTSPILPCSSSIPMVIICSHNKVEQRDNPLSVPIRTWVGSAFFVLPVIGMIIVVEEYLFPTSFWTIRDVYKRQPGFLPGLS